MLAINSALHLPALLDLWLCEWVHAEQIFSGCIYTLGYTKNAIMFCMRVSPGFVSMCVTNFHGFKGLPISTLAFPSLISFFVLATLHHSLPLAFLHISSAIYQLFASPIPLALSSSCQALHTWPIVLFVCPMSVLQAFLLSLIPILWCLSIFVSFQSLSRLVHISLGHTSLLLFHHLYAPIFRLFALVNNFLVLCTSGFNFPSATYCGTRLLWSLCQICLEFVIDFVPWRLAPTRGCWFSWSQRPVLVSAKNPLTRKNCALLVLLAVQYTASFAAFVVHLSFLNHCLTLSPLALSPLFHFWSRALKSLINTALLVSPFSMLLRTFL